MSAKSWGSALSSLLITVLVAAGVVTTVAPAHAATTVSYSNTGIVRAGTASNQDFIVSLSGIGTVWGVKVTFTGATLVNSGSWGGPFNSGTAPTYVGCPTSPADVLYSSATSAQGMCYLGGTYANWGGGSSGSQQMDAGGSFNVKFPAGKLNFAASGPYQVVVEYNGMTVSTQTLNSLSPQAALSVTSTTGTYGSPLTLTTSGGSGTGAVSYSVANGTATGCTVAGGNLSATSAGTCLVTATKGADSTYSAISSTQTTVTLAKATRTLSFGSTTTYTLVYGATQTVMATPSAGAGDGAVTYSAGASTACTVDTSGLIRVTASSGSCIVSASIAQGTNYLAASTTTQVIVNGTVKAITITGGSPTVIYGGASFNPTALDIAGALVGTQQLNSSAAVFTYTGFNGTSYGPTTTRPTDAGWYHVLPSNVTTETPGHVDTTANYNITYASGSLEIRRASRTISFGTTTYTVAYGDIQTVSATATAGDGAISYSAGSSTACSVDSATGVVTVTAATGTCEISSMVAQGTNYLTATTTTPVTITTTARSITVTASSPAISYGGTVTTANSVTSGTLAGSDAISGVTYNFAGTGTTAYASSTTAPTAAGTYSVTPSIAVFSTGSASNYSITYAAGTLNIAQAGRTVSFATTAYSLEYGATQQIAATPSAGSSEGVLSYTVSSGSACTVNSSSGLVTVVSSSGTCQLSATITAGANYQSATTTTPVTISVGNRAITITAGSPTITYGGTVTPSFSVTSGTLSGTDAISTVIYRYEGTGSTVYDSSVVKPTAAGTYSITPSIAMFSPGSSTDYNITYAVGTLTISKATRTLTFASTAYNLHYGDTQTVASSASAGTGAITYSAGSSTACSVNSSTGVISVNAANGTCEISSTIAADANYESATTVTPVTVTVSARAITLTATSPAITVGGNVTPTYTITNGTLEGGDSISGATYNFAGTGTTTYANSTTPPTAIGTYSMTPSVAVFSTGSAANYAITYVAGTLTISNKTARTLSFQTTAYTLEFGQSQTVTAAVSGGPFDGTTTYSAGSSSACSVDATTGLIEVTSGTGSCEVTASITEGTTYLSATTTVPVTVTVSPRALTISATDLNVTYGGAVSPVYSLTAGSMYGTDAISGVSYQYAGTGSTTFATSSTAPTNGGTYSITPSTAVFSSGLASNYNVTYRAGALTINQTRTPAVDIDLAAALGMYVVGTQIFFSASGLQPTAGYELVVRSTPRVLASANAVGGAINSSATMPGGLEGGWHTLTFSSTAADGTILTGTYYFKISDSGMLLEKTATKPLELALTGGNSGWLLFGGLLAQIMGLAMVGLVKYRRRMG